MPDTHLIDKVSIELELARSSTAWRYQHIASSWLREEACGIMQQACDHASVGSRHLVIDKLVLDLGRIPAQVLRDQLTAAMKREFKPERLQARVKFSEQKTQAASQPHRTYSQQQLSDPETETSLREFEIFIHFLQTGTLPWYVDSTQSIDMDALLEGLIKKEAIESKRVKAVLDRSACRQRLIKQFKESNMQVLYCMMFDEYRTLDWEAFFETLEQLLMQQSLPAAIKTISWDQLWQGSLKNLTLVKMLSEIWQRIILRDAAKAEQITRVFENNQNDLAKALKSESSRLRLSFSELENRMQATPGSLQKIQGADSVTASPATRKNKPSRAATEKKYPGTAVEQAHVEQAHIEQTHAEQAHKNQHEISIADKIFNFQESEARSELDVTAEAQSEELSRFAVHNAGLILFHPFLNTLFSALGLAHDSQFKNSLCQQKSIHILQYLVAGKEKVAEHQLVLNKLLTNWPLQQTLDREIRLKSAEKNECKQLIDALIGHWSILGETSMQAFRENFLQRKGVLSEQESGWLLRVEHGAYDVLVEHIPWGISLVKLPWMDKPLQVEWDYAG
jgi:hypothetical protein